MCYICCTRLADLLRALGFITKIITELNHAFDITSTWYPLTIIILITSCYSLVTDFVLNIKIEDKSFLYFWFHFITQDCLLRTSRTPTNMWSVCPLHHVGKEPSHVWCIPFSPIPDCPSLWQNHTVTGRESMKTQVKICGLFCIWYYNVYVYVILSRSKWSMEKNIFN